MPTTVENTYPQYQYDAANTVPDVRGPIGAVRSLFEFGRGGFSPGHRLGSPSLRDGPLYLTEGRIDADGDARTTVHAVGAVDERSQWSRASQGTNGAGPTAVTDDTIYAVADGGLSAFSLTGSQRRYAVDVGGDGTPVVADNVVYFPAEKLYAIAG